MSVNEGCPGKLIGEQHAVEDRDDAGGLALLR
jgi:hypothetical protein